MAASDPARMPRDLEIFLAYQGGASSCRLAAVYHLSPQRITQIVTAVAKLQGVPLLPPVWRPNTSSAGPLAANGSVGGAGGRLARLIGAVVNSPFG